MNPGYLSFVCLFFILVFSWMGTMDALFSRLRIQARTFFILLGVFYLTSGWFIPFGMGACSVGAFLLPFVFFFALWSRQERDIRQYSFTAALLCGVTLFLFRYMLMIDPILQVADEVYLVAGVAASLAPFMTRKPEQAFIIIGFGLCLMEVLVQFFLYSYAPSVTLGGFIFRDMLVLSLLVGMALHSVLFFCLRISMSLMRKVLVKRGR
ncbi:MULTISPECIES: hypothetical protein [Aneurinibacillus]|uniref:Uncharacterized protein n=1 Tax=Aneurinibacillus thermoaerophilus TaxID=143495 RepID=A0A1G7XJ57_ANETH|nr:MULTISPECIES: hypothetical protein [Aneurinibacillus]AMA73593.1 hypothetical protein ACH33_12485 [Aneurinibacillus sp. XH2]MED0674985.1 hypothetical protein [Aneurinibacillus thermoaerophilus]MED0679614.1 hypothetical protein [Aneurinibacillus thermoaerophilus]MED0737388.1 hypothetical protein [Aneurinibacillus thermoaerophilus]MED0756237.1 hypothetical protein [Aneurinibacillus thermoaerophilus]